MQRRRERRAELKRQQQPLFRVAVPALVEIGGTVVHCCYDGGNDEGFAWFHSLETCNGRWNEHEVIAALSRIGLSEKLGAEASLSHDSSGDPDLDGFLDALAGAWAMFLLSPGFGTGQYQMYGAFKVNLLSLTISDDPQARPDSKGHIKFPSSSNGK